MVEPAPSQCEVKVDGQWLEVSLAEASTLSVAADKRCPACHGRLTMPGTFTWTETRRFAHHRKHDGCPMLPKIYCGTPSPHPNAVV